MRLDGDDLSTVHDDGGVTEQMASPVDHPRCANDDGIGEGGGGEEEEQGDQAAHGQKSATSQSVFGGSHPWGGGTAPLIDCRVSSERDRLARTLAARGSRLVRRIVV